MAGKIGGTISGTSLGSDIASIPQEGTAAYEQWRKTENNKWLTPAFASQVATMAKTYPNAGAGTVLALSKAGASPNQQTSSAAATLDTQSSVDIQREAAKQAAAKLKEANKVSKGSPVDFLAPLTRTAFMALTTPFELLEGSIRQIAAGRAPNLFNTWDETQSGQAIKSLLTTGKVDVGSGFLGTDANSAVGKALLKAQISGGPKMKYGGPWTYASGMTQALFEDPESKAARTFQATAGFVMNLALDPLTYVPGVGLIKLSKTGATLRFGPKAAAAAALAKAQPVKNVLREGQDIAGELKATMADARVASGDIAMLEGDIAKHAADVEELMPEMDRLYELTHTAKTQADLIDAQYGELSQRRDTLFAALKKEGETSAELVGKKRKGEDLMAHRLELNSAGRAAEVQGILDAKGFDEVVKTSETLAQQEKFAPGLIHTTEEAALKKGDRPAVQGLQGTDELVVRVAAKQKPRLVTWSALVKAGDSPQATRLGNELGSNLIDIASKAGVADEKVQKVLDVIDTPGALHGEVVDAAVKLGIVDNLYQAYQKSGIQGFDQVGATRGVGGGGYAYFAQTVDPFAAKLSDFGRFKADAINSPDILDFGKQAGTTEGAITQQVGGMAQGAAAGRLTVMEQIAELDKQIAEKGNLVSAAQKEFDKYDSIYQSNLKFVQDHAATQAEAKSALEEAMGRRQLATESYFGLTTIAGKQILDYQKASDAFFGPLGRNVSKMIATHYAPDQYYDLWKAMNGKVTVAVAKELAAAGTEKEVLQILAGQIGLDLGTGTRLGLSAQSRALKIESGLYNPNSLQLARAVKEKFLLNSFVEKGLTKVNDSIFTRMAPTKDLIHLDDVDKLVRQMHDVLPFIGASEALRTSAVKAMMKSETSTERFNVFIDTITSVVKEQMPKLSEEQGKMLESAARVFKKEQDANRRFLAQVAGNGTDVQEVISAGKKITVSELDPLLDSQLANYIKWPDTNAMRQLTGKTRNILSRSEGAQQFRTVSTELFDTFFKQSVLVGRLSYIERNIMDMQVRSFFAGSTTLFNHPLRFIAMSMGNPEGNAMAKYLTRMSRFDNTVFGNRFDDLVKQVDVDGFKGAALSDADKYAVMMSRSYGMGVGQGQRMLPTGMRFIGKDEKQFNRAWAGAILQYRESTIARLVAGGINGGSIDAAGKLKPLFPEAKAFLAKKEAQGLTLANNEKQIITDFMFETEQGNLLRKQLGGISQQHNAIFNAEDLNVAKDAVSQYMDIIVKGVDNLAGGRQEIRDFIAGKHMVDIKGQKLKGKNGFDPKGNTAKDVWLSRILKDYRNADAVNVDNAIGQLKLPAESYETAGALKGTWDKAAAKFFRFSATVEKRMALGPEYRQQYWNSVGEHINLMSKAEAEKILPIAEKELSGTKIFGVPANFTNPALSKMREAIKTLDDRGLSVDDMHGVASNLAADKIQKLYYDAMRQRQYAVALRMVAPFIGAFANTIDVWGKLVAKDVTNTFKLQGKARVYKATNAFEFLTHPETGVIYEWTNDNWNDPGQGFIYKDPTYGDPRMILPFVGDILGGMLGTVAGEKVPGMPTSLSIPSLNLAFSNELLPGVGPGIQLTVGKVVQNQNGWIADQLRNIIYPFGAPDSKTGIVESFTPAWAQRLLYGLGVNSYEAKNLSTLRPIMTYLATTGKYGEFPLDGPNQQRLLEDSGKLNRVLALWRGIFANLSPGAIAPNILAKDKTGDFHVQALMMNDFLQIRANNPDNYAVSIAKWAEKYGDSALFALVSGSRGGVQPTSEAWNFYLNNRDDALQYKNAFSLFFPGGQYSQEFAKWQEQTGQRFKLSPADMMAEAARYVYSARKAKLQSDEATAIMQGTDPKDAHAMYQSRKETLDGDFGGQPDYRSAGVPRETLIKEVTAALSNDKFAATESGKGLAEFLQYRKAATDAAAQSGYKTLTGVSVKPIAEWLDNAAYQVIAAYPEFSVMYWRIFATETGNQ